MAPAIHQEKSPLIVLVPCGPVERRDLEVLTHAFSERGMSVRITEERNVPLAAFNRRRQQYEAGPLLKIAQREAGDRVLAITNYDLYDGHLNFVFGLAESPGKGAVISLFRLRMTADEETFRQRAVKEAVHELGHTWGLAHCHNPRCVMHFSNSLQDTDRKESDWCESCDKKLQNPQLFLLPQRWRSICRNQRSA